MTRADGNDISTLKKARREESTERRVAAPELTRMEPINKAHMELPFLLEPDTFVTMTGKFVLPE